MIYFVRQAGGVGPIKIGVSDQPDRRIRNLRWEYNCDLEIIACFPGDRLVEKIVHDKFEGLRADPPLDGVPGSTEWFAPEEPLLQFIETAKASGNLEFLDKELRARPHNGAPKNDEERNTIFVNALKHGNGPDTFIWNGHKQTNFRASYDYATASPRAREELAESLRTDRDPCFVCGVRADLHEQFGCRK